MESRDIAVGIATGYGLDDRGVRVQVPAASRISLSFLPALQPTQPPIQWLPANLSLGVKWPGSKTDHSPPTSAEIKKAHIKSIHPFPGFLHGVVLN
jgi:hypothetical protein